ncbi:MAG TPA: hypothetical protein VMV07_24175 [Streptosporangiaceae bacterium]|nr:hypothetical protein [Streptosporangiaceae bacterium]
MSVTVLGAVRSCGTTTLGVALAATWPAGRRVLRVELDPAGGTLAGASGWAAEPSLVSVAAAARRTSDPEAIWAHCQHLPEGASVLAAPAGAEQTRGAVGMLAGLLDRLGELDADVLVDVGRLDAAAPMPPVASGAGRVVLVARPRLCDLHALATFVEARTVGASRLEAGRMGLVLVGDGPYPDDEVAGALGIEVLGRLPWDPQAAEQLTSLPASDRQLRLSPLVRAARTLADRLVADTAPTAAVAAGDPAPAAGSLRVRMLRPFRIGAAVGTGNGSAGREGAST